MAKNKPLRITLNPQEDEHMRGWVKDIIQGAISSITRDELRDMVIDAAKIDGAVEKATQEIKRAAETLVQRAANGYNDAASLHLRSLFEDAIRSEVKRQLANMVSVEFVEKLITSRTEIVVKNIIQRIISDVGTDK